MAKVVVVGQGEAGKSTLIGRLCREALNVEVGGRTVAMDHGMLRSGEAKVSLVGVPGQARFEGVREALADGATAAIWVQRAEEDPDTPSADLLATLDIPYLVIRNVRGDVLPADSTVRGSWGVVSCNLLAAEEREISGVRSQIHELVAFAKKGRG